MPTWFVTFPQRLCTRDCYRRVEADDLEHARRAVVRHHGTAWAFIYPIDELVEQVERFGLTEITPAIDANADRAPQMTAPTSCIGCGCTDRWACRGGCWWLVVDRAMGRGVCSNCGDSMKAWEAQRATGNAHGDGGQHG